MDLKKLKRLVSLIDSLLHTLSSAEMKKNNHLKGKTQKLKKAKDYLNAIIHEKEKKSYES